VRLILPILFALYLLFWFFEGLGSVRVDAIAAWSTKHNVLALENKTGEVYPPGLVFSSNLEVSP
jgi:hypothetical protein